MCGGVASQSRRHELFATVTTEEYMRLQALFLGIRTAQDIEHSFGAPDQEENLKPPPELRMVQPKAGIREDGNIRILTYARLSQSANVQFTVYSNGEVEGLIAQKYVGPPGFTDT
jgi:hypothetical protein